MGLRRRYTPFLFCFSVLVFTDLSPVSSLFPWNSAAGLSLFVGGPLLNTPPPKLYPEANLTVEGIIRYYGYPFEKHQVTTSDGYVLEIHRIPCRHEDSECFHRSPIVFIPGILASSSMYVFNGKENSPAFILSDAGYDIWLANVRGTKFGRKNIYFSPDTQKFWNFSFHEMGIFDLPKTIDYVLTHVGHNQTHLLATSMGTDISTVLLSDLPEYNSRVKSVFLLAPTIRFSQFKALTETPAIVRVADVLFDLFQFVFEKMEVFPNTKNMAKIFQNVCGGIGVTVCRFLTGVLFGYDPVALNLLRIPTVVNHYPAGTSTKNIVHFYQVIKSGKYQHFDYGLKGNLELYGTTTPREYNLSQITAPVVIMFGQRDDLGFFNPDIEWLGRSVLNLVEYYRVPFDTFSHLSFFLALDGRHTVYDEVIRVIANLEKK